MAAAPLGVEHAWLGKHPRPDLLSHGKVAVGELAPVLLAGDYQMDKACHVGGGVSSLASKPCCMAADAGASARGPDLIVRRRCSTGVMHWSGHQWFLKAV